jgi:hypothetical protein
MHDGVSLVAGDQVRWVTREPVGAAAAPAPTGRELRGAANYTDLLKGLQPDDAVFFIF